MNRFENRAVSLCPHFSVHGASVCCDVCRRITTALREEYERGEAVARAGTTHGQGGGYRQGGLVGRDK